MRPSSITKQAGLTLVELLVAIGVLGIVAVLGWRGLDSIVRTRIALTSDLEQTRGMQLTFAQLQSDCDHLYNFTVSKARVPIVARQNSLTLIRTVYADNQPSRLQVISYRVDDGVLTRRESVPTRDLRELDTLWSSAVNDTDTGQGVILQSGVSAMAMRLWFSDGNGWRADTGRLLAAAGSSAVLPVASGLEVTVQLQGRENSLLKIFLLGAV
jgi:general secretion pathway protein J